MYDSTLLPYLIVLYVVQKPHAKQLFYTNAIKLMLIYANETYVTALTILPYVG